MDEEGRRNASNTNTTLVPSVYLNLRSVENILAERNAVGGGPSEKNRIPGIDSCGEETRVTVDVFKVVLLATVSRDSGTEFHVHKGTGQSNDHTNNPHEEGETNRAREFQNGTRRGKDTGSNHAVEDEEGRREDSDLTFGLTLLLKTT